MTLDEILASLFPEAREVRVEDGLVLGWGRLPNAPSVGSTGSRCDPAFPSIAPPQAAECDSSPVNGGASERRDPPPRSGGGGSARSAETEGASGRSTNVHVIGLADGTPLGVEGALALAGQVLAAVRAGDQAPILLPIDSSSQRMSRRDELLGLNEHLAHLAKTLLLAEAHGHRTVGLLYGGSAAGAFIATALAAGTLAALPGAHPAVMDLPSMARVTKLPIEVLQAKARTTPVFAPGLDNLAQTGAIHAVWDPARPLAPQLAALLAEVPGGDLRDRLGQARGGRPKAAAIAARVAALAVDGDGGHG